MNDQNFKNLCLKIFHFCKILKMHKNNTMKPANFCYAVQREDAQSYSRSQLIEDGYWARSALKLKKLFKKGIKGRMFKNEKRKSIRINVSCIRTNENINDLSKYRLNRIKRFTRSNCNLTLVLVNLHFKSVFYLESMSSFLGESQKINFLMFFFQTLLVHHQLNTYYTI